MEQGFVGDLHGMKMNQDYSLTAIKDRMMFLVVSEWEDMVVILLEIESIAAKTQQVSIDLQG
jgi:hypothetical protein